MVENDHKQRKGTLSEEDMSSLLQRYSATTVLALLQELAQVPEAKIDWNALVKNSSTGITSAREYQMLWRHLAYRHALLEKFEDGAEPLDDDSDLECEVEPFPAVSSESMAEAAACVKVLISSGLPGDPNAPNTSTVEAPLTINLPSSQLSRVHVQNSQSASSKEGTYITIPVSVQRQSLPAPSPAAEGLEPKGPANGIPLSRRKRKPWSEAEDLELIAAVQKFGEGNWANIVRGEFKGDRTASQLSQRWAIIRRRNGNLNTVGNSTGTQLSEAQRAARHAMSLALNIPVNNLTIGSAIGPATTSNAGPPTSSGAGWNQSQRSSIPTKPPPVGPSASAAPSPRNTATKLTVSSDSMVRATAVAAGARIASPSDAASLLKAAQAKNAIHIMTTSNPAIKPSKPGSASAALNVHPNAHQSAGSKMAPALPSDLAAPPHDQQAGSTKAESLAAKHNKSDSVAAVHVSSEQAIAAGYVLETESSLEQEEDITRQKRKETEPVCASKVLEKDDHCDLTKKSMEMSQKDRLASAECGARETALENHKAEGALADSETEGDRKAAIENRKILADSQATKGDHKATAMDQSEEREMTMDSAIHVPDEIAAENQPTGNCDPNKIEKQQDLPSMAADGRLEGIEQS